MKAPCSRWPSDDFHLLTLRGASLLRGSGRGRHTISLGGPKWPVEGTDCAGSAGAPSGLEYQANFPNFAVFDSAVTHVLHKNAIEYAALSERRVF